MNLDDDTLAKTMAKIQLENKYPGLMQEVKEILKEYKLDDLDPNEYSKMAWKRIIKKTLKTKFVNDLLGKMKSCSKIKKEEREVKDFKLQDYFETMNLQDSSMKFAMECNMVPCVKYNFMSKDAYEKSSWACDFCMSKGSYKLDSMSHILKCEQFCDMRNNLNLHVDEDRVQYLTRIGKFRNSLTYSSQSE